MSSFGNAIMGFFGGASTGGGGGTSTGVNGLNGTTNIGLGGTLTGSTYIFGGGFDFVITQANSLIFEGSNVLGSASIGNYGNSIRLLTTAIGGTTSSFYVEDTKIYTYAYSNGNIGEIGLQLDFASSKFTLGDYDNLNNQFKLIVDDANSLISTTDSNGTNGLQIGTGFTNIGQFTGGYTYIGINQTTATIQTFDTATLSNGLSLDFNVGSYLFGSFNSVGNFIQIDDTLNSILTYTSNLIFEGASLQSGSSGGNSGEHLVITLNGSQYKIALQNP